MRVFGLCEGFSVRAFFAIYVPSTQGCTGFQVRVGGGAVVAAGGVFCAKRQPDIAYVHVEHVSICGLVEGMINIKYNRFDVIAECGNRELRSR